MSDSMESDWFTRLVCGWLHGGGDIKRDDSGRINWRCRKCGGWADPIPLATENAAIDAAMKDADREGERA